MANTKAAKQDILTNKRNHQRNLESKAEYKGLFKELRRAENPTPEFLEELLRKIHRTLDRISKQVLSTNRASRMKSFAAKKVKALLAEKTA